MKSEKGDIIGRGAEAVIYRNGTQVIKERIRKNYRIEELDATLRKSRTRREAKIIEKLKEQGIACPELLETDRQQKIIMSFIEGGKLRDVLESSDYNSLCKELGEKIAKMHNAGIIHGDLTTSNMIVNAKEEGKLYFIDFGLSFFSEKVEDMAVDLHLLRQALESKHYLIWKECFDSTLFGYKKISKKAQEVINRLEVVESRGRYKRKK